MKMNKTLLWISVVVLLAILFPTPFTCAANQPTIVLTDASIDGGTEELAEIQVLLKENPGIASIKLTIRYDEKVFELVSASFSSEAMTYQAQTIVNTELPGTVILNYLLIDGEMNLNGVLATIMLKLTPGAANGVYAMQLTFDQDDLYNQAYENVEFAKQEGKINVNGQVPPKESIPAKPSESIEPTSSATYPFTDVQDRDWYAESVQFVWEKGLMSGVSAELFDPGRELTRAMLVTVLYRLDGEPETGSQGFKDVGQSAYYTEAVAWAAEKGLVLGYEDGCFYPDHPISREQLVTILWRYSSEPEKEIYGRETLESYLDAGEVSSYAVNAMAWGVRTGLIKGTGNNCLQPKAPTTRAQTAELLWRYIIAYQD